MKVAGFGFRRAASLASLRGALAAAGGAQGIGILATLAPKVCSPAFMALAEELGLPICPIGADMLPSLTTPTVSDRIMRRFGTGSIAEATALAAAGQGASLLVSRVLSSDGMATAAIAERTVPDMAKNVTQKDITA